MFKQLHTKGGVRTGLYIFVMVSTILGNYGSLNLSIPVAQAASGSIWTTTGSCGSPQNSNHYNVGDHVFINASGFDADTPYSWDITGQPSSGDPNTAVASGSQLTDDSGAVCFDAYTIQADDSGEYKATYGDKHDNYQVNGQPAAPQCGNGIIETGETCDDGNTVSGDGCSSQCQIEVPQQGPQCGNGVIESGETCDDGNTVNGDGCNSQCQIETPSSSIKVVATKIVCQNESDLPNWGETGMPDITASTSADFLATHPTCHLQSDWKFQWGFGDKDGQEGVDKLPGAFVGEADGTDTTGMCSAPWCGPNTNTGTGYSDWKTFGPTGSDGTTSVDITDMQGANQLWVREVLQDGYIPFTYPPQGPNENNVTAEIYCHTDTNHYDNYDSVDNPTAGNTYYCVAFNAPKVTPPTDLCPNIEGDQAEVPQGYAINSDGQCVPDVCPNLDGIQSSLPDGYTVNNDGQCVLITDLCPNIDGIQASIPDGMILNNDGQCVDSGSGGGPITTSGGGGGGSHGGGGGIPDFPNQPTGPQDNPQVKGFSTSAPADNPSVLGFELLPNTGGSLTDYYVTTSLLFALILGGLYVSYRKRSAANS